MALLRAPQSKTLTIAGGILPGAAVVQAVLRACYAANTDAMLCGQAVASFATASSALVVVLEGGGGNAIVGTARKPPPPVHP